MRNTPNRNNNKPGAVPAAPFQKDMKQELTPQQKAAIEYNRRINANEFTYPEALRDKSVYDVLIMPEFSAILTAYINEQVETRTKVLETIAKLKEQGKRVAENRPTIDRVMDLGLMKDPGDFAVEFARVLNHQSKHQAAIRLYIHQLGMKAYNATIEKFICDANPDMAELLKQATATNKS